MIDKFQIAYIPVGVPTFHLESAQNEFDKTKFLLREIDASIVFPDKMLLSIDLLIEYLESINPSLIIFQNLTFANSAYISEVVRYFDCNVLLWTLPEPIIDGGRLRLNSLTGAFSAGNTLKAFGISFSYVYGSPDERAVKKQVTAIINAAKVIYELKGLKLAQIGHTPEGFGFGRALDAEIMKTYGCKLISVEARELIESAKSYSDEEVKDYLLDANKRIRGLENIPGNNRLDFARLYKAYKEFTVSNKVAAIASRCWPDFFTAFGTPVCTVLGILNDLGVAASCEADTYGALSMKIGMSLSGNPVFFGDPVSIDEKENTITYWHCGTAACSLAQSSKGALAGVHCNRKIGPTLEFGCKAAEKVTVFRFGKNGEGKDRVFLTTGEALDKPKQFSGTSLVVKTNSNVRNIIENSIKDGFEPHFIVAYGDICLEIKSLCEMLSIEVCEY